jgi:NTE family protein
MYKFTLVFFLIIVLNFPFMTEAQPQTDSKKLQRPKVGLVLSGGGAKGFAYVGLLKVLEEAGLPVDYIGGSSIGSIIGGLYAIGYHPDTIAKMIRSQDWDNLLRDVMERKFVAYEEKKNSENNLITLPLKNRKIGISSMYKGQEINLLLNEYFSPASTITDFNKLPIPFLCIGTNLFTGEQVVLRKGYLPMAIRSSMSIPGYFTPTDYHGYFLVDGGVVNNYPAREVKAMGADIIVGGDVQTGLLTTREELASIPAILNQITSFSRLRANEIGDSLTDIKIKIKMPYGMMDFTHYDSIISIGEAVARNHFPAIKALADSLNRIEYRPLPSRKVTELRSVTVDKVVIRGNKKLSDEYFQSIFGEYANHDIKLSELQKDIRLTYGSGYFDNIGYSIENDGTKNNLVIDVIEAGPGELAAGIHYDSDYGIVLMMKGAFRNVLGSNTKLFADINVAVNPRVRVHYLHGLGGKASLGFHGEFYTFVIDSYDKDVKVNKFHLTNYKGSAFFNYNFRNLVNLNSGFEYEYFRFRQDIVIDSLLIPLETFSGYGTLYFALNADTRDKPYYATRGVSCSVRFEYVLPLSKNWSKEIFTNSVLIYGNYDHYIPLARKLVLQPGFFAGATLQNTSSPPVHHLFGFGGETPENYIKTIVPFTGMHFVQEFGYYSLIGRMKLQYNIYNKLYLSLKADAGANADYIPNMVDPANTLFGYGVTASYHSFIGPVELSVMGSNVNSSPMLYLNVGFWF